MSKVWLGAPAKINWSLEVLGKRRDGYHEIRTVLQTITMADRIELRPAEDLSLFVSGATRGFRRASRESPESNLAYRAAVLLKERTGVQAGAQIWLKKRIPVAAGLGGGSSDAAAVLRGLRRLWAVPLSDPDLCSLAAELGSDVPFFLHGGTAMVTGRGEVVASLPDAHHRWVYLVQPPRQAFGDKTAHMYRALRPEHCSDGSRTERLAERVRAGEPIRDEDVHNVFEAVLPEVDPEAADIFLRAAALGIGQPHLCGSGPNFFFLTELDTARLRETRQLLSTLPCWAAPYPVLPARLAAQVYEVP